MSLHKDQSKSSVAMHTPTVRGAAELDEALSSEAGIADEVTILDEKLAERETTLAHEAAEILAESEKKVKSLGIEEALQEEQVRALDSNRQKTRLLILTRDCTVSHENGLAQKRILELAEIFAEIHIVVLSEKGECFERTTRLTDNVWLYPTESQSWWKTPFDAFQVAERQLTFGGGFRADIIIAEDPFECAAAAYYLAREFERIFEIHLFEDYFDPAYQRHEEHAGIKLFVARRFLKRADCIRTKSAYLHDKLIESLPMLARRTEVFPLYHNLNAWKDAQPVFTLKERYPAFSFFLLSISAMTDRSRTDDVLRSVSPILKRYPNITLILVGDGPNKEELMRCAVTYGIGTQVQFEPATNDLVSHMKTANLLVHLSEDAEEDYVVFQAAAVGLPIVTGASGVLGELFLDEENAFVCPNDSTTCVTGKINTFLSHNDLRVRFAMNAKDMIFERIEQDYGAYLKAYQASIERCIREEM